MRNSIALILLLMSPCVLVTSRSVHQRDDTGAGAALPFIENPQRQEHSPDEVISVRITSSVNVGRGRGKLNKVIDKNLNDKVTVSDETANIKATVPVTQKTTSSISTTQWITETVPTETTDPLPVGANLEFIKQLNSKKEARGLSNFERVHSFPSYFNDNNNENEAEDSVAEASVKSIFGLDDENLDHIADVPLARSVAQSPSQNNFIHDLPKAMIEKNNQKLTTVSFNIVHDTPKVTSNYNGHSEAYEESQPQTEPPKPQDQSDYHKPAEIYSEPSKVYGEPSKVYSEPSKIYSEPAKVYGEPAKVYGEPAKIYSEPSKFYSQPASLHLPEPLPTFTSWQQYSQSPAMTSSSTISSTPMTMTTVSNPTVTRKRDKDHQPEKNYEVDEKISVLTEGRSHGVQESSTERCKQENCKVGYVVEGRQYRKYRVEEKTSEGFIVGEYGVVRNEDGALRGVRYTADSDASPRLIYDALMKFLQLK